MESNKPYNELPLLPPEKKGWEKIEVYKILAEARAALAELKGRCPVIPNPFMLINTLVLQEAKDSSSIENIFTTSDKLYRAFASSTASADPQTKEVLRYRQALLTAWNEIQQSDISIDIIESIYRQIKEKEDGVRDSQVFVGNAFQTIYTPPCCRDLLIQKLNNLIDFAESDKETDPLIKMALMHYQFEAIHPFTDGNGRTGRVLNVLFISKWGLLDQPVLYLSKYINTYKNDYYRLLRDVTENNNWTEWIIYMLTAVKETAVFTLKKVNTIYQLFLSTIEKIKNEVPDVYSFELVSLLFEQPYCKIGFVVEAGIASRNTASKYLGKLVEIKVLEKKQAGNEALFLNINLYNILIE
jgi:Fic family protein